MIRSMTGYGKAEESISGRKYIAEVKTINSKQFDPLVRLPTNLKHKELDIRSLLAAMLERGKIDFTLSIEGSDRQEEMVLNKPLLKKYYQELVSLENELEIKRENPFGLDSLLQLPNVFELQNDISDEEIWDDLLEIVQKAIADCDTMRIAEGTNLKSDFIARTNMILDLIEQIEPFENERILKIREKLWFDSLEILKQFQAIDSEYFINQAIDNNKKVLAEGAQGTMLDIDFGSYPFVTSSNTVSAGVCSGLGVAPSKIGKVFGVFKAYCTRVGNGPFPTELNDETGQMIRETGNEYGATTGRPRRCGWLDLTALKYSIMLNGVTDLIMTKGDVLTGFEKIKVSNGYLSGNQKINHVPYDIEPVLPIYEEIDGWQSPVETIATYDELPDALKDYVNIIEKRTKTPISIISVGPDRSQTIIRS
jgi:adenylosuccinate synthase